MADESAESVIDWWSKYYASVDKIQQVRVVRALHCRSRGHWDASEGVARVTDLPQ